MEGAQENPYYSAASKNPKSYESSRKIWSIYISEAEKYDKAAAESWKGDMDGILIFAGLFSAVVTAFIIESYKGLKPDPGDTTVALLSQISQQLVAISNGSQATTPTLAPIFLPFVPSPSVVRVNILWFLSLAFSLGCALTATLVQQWTRNYIQATKRRPTPYRHARIRAYLWHGAKTFRLADVVRAVPFLLHISVCLFFVGLIDFLGSLHETIGRMILVILLFCCALYGAITILPSLYRNCPYRTPLSELWWHIMQLFGLLRYVNAEGKWLRMTGKMADGPEREAMVSSSHQGERDLEALQWTVELLMEDAELEPFVEGIPEFIHSPHVAKGQDIMEELLVKELGDGVYRLLSAACCSPILDASIKQQRIIVCLDAIFHVSQGFMGRVPWVSCIDIDTANLLCQLRHHESPKIAVRARCTVILTTCILFQDTMRMVLQEESEPRRDFLLYRTFSSLMTLVEDLRGAGYFDNDELSEIAKVYSPQGFSLKDTRQLHRQFQRSHSLEHFEVIKKKSNEWRFLGLVALAYSFLSNPTFASETLVIDTFVFMAKHPVLEVHAVPEDYQDEFVRLLAGAIDHGPIPQIPLAALDTLFNVAATLRHPALMERAVAIIDVYLSRHPDSAAAEKTVALLRAALSRNLPPMDGPAP